MIDDVVPREPRKISFRDLRDAILMLTDEQLDLDVEWFGDERGGHVSDLHVFTDDMVNPSGDGWETMTDYRRQQAEQGEPVNESEEIVGKKGQPFLMVDEFEDVEEELVSVVISSAVKEGLHEPAQVVTHTSKELGPLVAVCNVCGEDRRPCRVVCLDNDPLDGVLCAEHDTPDNEQLIWDGMIGPRKLSRIVLNNLRNSPSGISDTKEALTIVVEVVGELEASGDFLSDECTDRGEKLRAAEKELEVMRTYIDACHAVSAIVGSSPLVATERLTAEELCKKAWHEVLRLRPAPSKPATATT